MQWILKNLLKKKNGKNINWFDSFIMLTLLHEKIAAFFISTLLHRLDNLIGLMTAIAIKIF